MCFTRNAFCVELEKIKMFNISCSLLISQKTKQIKKYFLLIMFSYLGEKFSKMSDSESILGIVGKLYLKNMLPRFYSSVFLNLFFLS